MIHLRAHSYYSFCNALPSPKQLAQAAATQGLTALGLTDHDTLTGAVEFYEACQTQNIKPLLGLELTLASPFGSGNLALFATSLSGWRNLCCLSSSLHAQADQDPTHGLSLDQLGPYAADLLCLTGGVRGPLVGHLLQSGQGATLLRQLNELFRDHLYVELQFHDPRDTDSVSALANLAQTLSLPTVATHSIYYVDSNQADLQRTLASIRHSTPRDRLADDSLAPSGASFLTSVEMEAHFTDFPAALAATHEIADRCDLQLPLGVQHYPEIPLPAGVTAVDQLAQRARAGALELYGAITSEIDSRLERELSVIGQRGYAPLFLIVEEILTHARATGVPISSRGSAASSLVAHCLGITSPDPLRLNLYFERFLNPSRTTPPDIDTDLCSRRRDSVIQHVYDTYGHDRVAMVCTINRFRARSAVREVAKAYGLPEKDVKALADSLPYRGWGPPNRQGSDSPFAELLDQHPSPLYKALFKDAEAILGFPRHLSIHPGGVVISPGPMVELVPTYLATKGILITQFDLDSIESLGLIKIDLLGIRGLTVLGDVADTLTVSGGNPIQALNAISETDAATSDTIRAGRTIGCFQIESPGMRATLKEINAKSIDDLMTALALYRPGPLTGGLKDAFVRRHLGLEPIQQLHPALGPLLQDTYGVILYQEQVLRIAHDLAGLSLAEADLLRRAMSHFDPGKQMQTLQANFIAGAERVSGVPRDIAGRVWELMAAFAGYGFPKAHAASYAQVAWRSAWCKVHFPAQFMAAVLANWGGYYSQRVYLTEARRMGLAIRPPHVNHAGLQFSVSQVEGLPALFMGLDQVRDLTRRTQARILHERPFTSLYDFLSRVDPRPDEAANLIKVGGFQGFGAIGSLLRQLKQDKWEAGQMALFESRVEEEEDWPLAQRVAAQEELLGTGVDAHPLELLAGQIAQANALTTLGAAAQIGHRVRVAGMRQSWRRMGTPQGDYLYLMSLEDLEGMLDVLIAGEIYRRHRSVLTDSGPYVIEGVLEIDTDREEPLIRAEKIWRIE